MKDKENLVGFTVRVSPSFDSEIRQQCFIENVSKAELTRKALRYYLNNIKKED